MAWTMRPERLPVRRLRLLLLVLVMLLLAVVAAVVVVMEALALLLQQLLVLPALPLLVISSWPPVLADAAVLPLQLPASSIPMAIYVILLVVEREEKRIGTTKKSLKWWRCETRGRGPVVLCIVCNKHFTVR